MPDSPRYSLDCDALGSAERKVIEVYGREALSELFRFTVRLSLASEDTEDAVDLGALLAQPAQLAIQLPGRDERLVNGIVVRAERVASEDDAGHRHVEVDIGPRLELLDSVRRTRLFQRLTAIEIADRVLRDAAVEARKDLVGSYGPGELTVQFAESDLAFLRRLLEREGVFFFFEHEDGVHRLVLGDHTGAHPTIPGESTLRFGAQAADVDDDHVFELEGRHRLGPEAVALRDFDFLRPQRAVEGTAGGASDDDDGDGGPELYEYPSGRLTPGGAAQAAKIRLEEAAWEQSLAAGRSTGAGMTAGHQFSLVGAPFSDGDGDYVLVSVEHSGDTVGYSNALTAIPLDVPFRPPRVTPRPEAYGIETAVVTGPAGQEIFTDEHGRVKVRFRWDRESTEPADTSCWMRVRQPWAGNGFGSLFIPRIGQEVVVRFLDGDPDRPLVMGAVYNGQNAPPLSLPDAKTQSDLRSSSSPGGAGSNELRLEDTAGREEIFLHAQRNARIEVENDKAQVVGGNEALVVSGDREITVDGSARATIEGSDRGKIIGDQTLQVTGDRITDTHAAHTEGVAIAQSVNVAVMLSVEVAGQASETVGLAKAVTVGGALAVQVAQNADTSAKSKKLTVGGLHFEVVAGNRRVTVAKGAKGKYGGDLVMEVDEATREQTDGDDGETVDGAANLSLTELLAVSAKEIELKGTDKLSLVVGGQDLLDLAKSGGALKLSADKILLDGSEIKAKGGSVKHDAGGSAGSLDVAKKTARTTGGKAKGAGVSIHLAPGGDPSLANLAFEIKLPDGTVKKGTLDGSGKAKVSGLPPGELVLTFPGLEDS